MQAIKQVIETQKFWGGAESHNEELKAIVTR